MLKFILSDHTLFIPKFTELRVESVRPFKQYIEELDILEGTLLKDINYLIREAGLDMDIVSVRTDFKKCLEAAYAILSKNSDSISRDFSGRFEERSRLEYVIENKRVPCRIRAFIESNGKVVERISQEFQTFEEADSYINSCVMGV